MRGKSPATSLLPLWEKVAWTESAPDEGFASAERDPSPVFASRSHPLPQGERGRVSPANYGVIEIGEKSTNQLLGCTKPLIFGLIARGATSCAT